MKKVFCLGLSRSGTTSFHNYAKKFGLKSLHFPREFYTQQEKIGLHPKKDNLHLSIIGRILLRIQIKMDHKKDILKRLNDFDAFSDLPINLIYKSLFEIYPDAWFILIERDIDKWLKSMKWMLEERALYPLNHLEKKIAYVTYGTYTFDRDKLQKAYIRHNLECKEFFKSESNFYILNLDKGELNYNSLSKIFNLKIEGEMPNFKSYPSKKNSKHKILIYKLIRKIDFLDLIYICYRITKELNKNSFWKTFKRIRKQSRSTLLRNKGS